MSECQISHRTTQKKKNLLCVSVAKLYYQRLIWINLVLLMFVAFLPFPTAMLGNYPAQQYTVTLYAGCLALMGFIRAWLWWYASRNYRLIDKELDSRKIARLNRRGLIVPLIFLLSIVVAMFNPLVAMWLGVWSA
jgi:uncharacterized membrane protein